jgi:hypothetical protein
MAKISEIYHVKYDKIFESVLIYSIDDGIRQNQFELHSFNKYLKGTSRY